MSSKSVVSIRAVRREQWFQLVAEQERGELNQREFCELHRLTYSSFTRWRRLVMEARANDRVDRACEKVELSGFVPVDIAPSEVRHDVNGALSVTLPNGLRIEGIVPDTISTVAALIAVL